MTRRHNRLAPLAALACSAVSVLSACTGGGGGSPSPPAAAPGLPSCSTAVLAGWRTSGLAVLWVPRSGTSPSDLVSLPAAVAAMDVRNGEIKTYCPLPAATPTVQSPYSLPMRQGGTAYPDAPADPDLMLRTQWLSPDFTWFGAPGLPLINVATGRAVSTAGLPGEIAGVGHGLLVRMKGGWCTAPLPPGDPGCLPLPTEASSYVINGVSGEAADVHVDAERIQFGPTTAYAITDIDGPRMYRADTEPAASRHDAVVSVDLAPDGLGGFPTFIDAQPTHDQGGWFTVGDFLPLRVAYHHTMARHDLYAWMLGTGAQVSRALADSGRTAITAAPSLQGASTRITRFGALVDGTAQVLDLTATRNLHCPVPDSYCRILTWPDGSLAPQAP